MEEAPKEQIKIEESKKEKVNPIAILSYLGVLVLVPLLVEKQDEFVKFHARQGLVLFIAEIVTMVIGWFPIIGWIFGFFLWILWAALSVIGIINVLSGKKTSLPLIGQFADRFKV